MLMKSSELIYKDHPLTMDGVRNFADKVAVGDIIPTMRKIKVWTSSSSFTWHERFEKVKVTKKYPNLVEYQVDELDKNGEPVRELMTWNEMVIGYCKCSGVVSLEDEKENGRGRKSA